MFHNFCSLCCTGLFFANVSGGESHKHESVPQPTGTEKKLDQERTDVNTSFIGEFVQRGSDLRSVAFLFHLRVRVVLASGHRTARPNKNKVGWLAVILTQGKQKPWHKQRDSVERYSSWLCKDVFESLHEMHDCCS